MARQAEGDDEKPASWAVWVLLLVTSCVAIMVYEGLRTCIGVYTDRKKKNGKKKNGEVEARLRSHRPRSKAVKLKNEAPRKTRSDDDFYPEAVAARQAAGCLLHDDVLTTGSNQYVQKRFCRHCDKFWEYKTQWWRDEELQRSVAKRQFETDAASVASASVQDVGRG